MHAPGPAIERMTPSLQECEHEATLPTGLDRTALYSGGTEAVEVAIRLAQSATGRRHVVSFTTGFHGKSAGTRYTGRRYAEERAWLGLDWIHDVAYPACTEHDALGYDRCEDAGEAELAELDRLATGLDGGVAAVIVEPILGTAGNRPPQRRFLAALRELCSRRGWLLILDESITGMGRLGTWFAAGWYGVDPDILILGKAIGGGYPLSGVAAPARLAPGLVLHEADGRFTEAAEAVLRGGEALVL